MLWAKHEGQRARERRRGEEGETHVSTKLRFDSPVDWSRIVWIWLRTLLTLILEAMVLQCVRSGGGRKAR
jgi:hypothetical protein